MANCSDILSIPPPDLQGNAGCYLLLLHLENDLRMRVGALGEMEFRAGYYIYVGRARKNLRQRVARHLAAPVRLRWHIDYLRREGTIIEVCLVPTLEECALARELFSKSGFEVIRGFGSCDCGCRGHLIHTLSKPVLRSYGPVFAVKDPAERQF
jgi:sugar fermentation stimulation protein A